MLAEYLMQVANQYGEEPTQFIFDLTFVSYIF